jgi:hypothetical protein
MTGFANATCNNAFLLFSIGNAGVLIHAAVQRARCDKKSSRMKPARRNFFSMWFG